MSEMKLESFDDHILVGMKDPEYALAYLQDALGESVEDFMRALNKYAKANEGAEDYEFLVPLLLESVNAPTHEVTDETFRLLHKRIGTYIQS